MSKIPRHQEVHAMVRSHGQVKCITSCFIGDRDSFVKINIRRIKEIAEGNLGKSLISLLSTVRG